MEETNPCKRWTAARKVEVVLRILRGESLDTLSRELGIEIYTLEEWRNKAVQGMESGLKARSEDPLQHELDQAKKRLGELLMENELLQRKADRAPSFRMGRSKR
jgi:transposase